MKFSTDFAEIVLITEDVKVAAKFYEEVVGLTINRPTNKPTTDGRSSWTLST